MYEGGAHADPVSRSPRLPVPRSISRCGEKPRPAMLRRLIRGEMPGLSVARE
jgi:hypothetical protein